MQQKEQIKENNGILFGLLLNIYPKCPARFERYLGIKRYR